MICPECGGDGEYLCPECGGPDDEGNGNYGHMVECERCNGVGSLDD